MNVKKILTLILTTVLFVLAVPQIHANTVYPLDYFALREVISNVDMSPDGSQISLLKIPSKKADPILEIYDASDLTKAPFRVNADPMEIRGASWVSDTQLILNLRQRVRKKITGFNQGVFSGALAKLDLKTKKITKFELEGQSPRIASILVDDPNKILVSFEKSDNRGTFRFSQVLDYYSLDLKTGRQSLVLRGTPEVPFVEFDAKGNPRLGYSFSSATGMTSYHYRLPGEKRWKKFHQTHEDSFETFSVEGIDEQNNDIVFVTANNGHDKIGLWEFNVKSKKFGELIYRRNDVDIYGVRRHSNTWTNPGVVTGVRYVKKKINTVYFDEVEEATFKQLDSLIPYAHQVSITSRSADGNTLIIYNSGPQDPGTYYLLKNGKIRTIGSLQPLLKSEDLAELKYIKYKSRDGKDVYAYVTMPKGKGPFPTIVMPHGGPFVHEIVIYDEWAQMLANNGYMVVQPQYRGSQGYGMEHYLSSFKDGGEAGFKMQDDKDDAALYLVEKGLADKDRLAMFGWSYGGYAALIAASREEQIYQCSIAGAAVADMIMQVNYYLSRLRGAQLEQQVKYRKGSVNPIDVADKVNIPLLIIHGSVDQRVPVDHAEKYMKYLDKHNKPYKYVELDGADHFSNTLSYDHQYTIYKNITDFLKNDCGPSGL